MQKSMSESKKMFKQDKIHININKYIQLLLNCSNFLKSIFIFFYDSSSRQLNTFFTFSDFLDFPINYLVIIEWNN